MGSIMTNTTDLEILLKTGSGFGTTNFQLAKQEKKMASSNLVNIS